MKSILTFDNLIDDIKKIDSTEEQAIALIMAPYNIEHVAHIIDQIYDVYDYHCENSRVHLYWIGYIKSYNARYRWKVNHHYNNDLYFDLTIFDQISKKLNENWSFDYKNRFEIVFIKVHKNKIYFNEHIRVDFDKTFIDSYDMINFISKINDAMNNFKYFKRLKLEIRNQRKITRIRKIKLSDLFEFFSIFIEIK